jgi:myo-inositol-1(or 4)-monophosphatase
VPPDALSLLDLAERAARAAGALLVERFAAADGAGDVRTKSTPTDLVSEADLAAERAVRALLREARPDDAIRGEEGDDQPGGSGLAWIVDPLDGTVNYLFGNPQWAVSVAVEDGEGTLAGVVLDPLRGEAFRAARGQGAWVGGERLRPRAARPLEQALVATGFAYAADRRARQAQVLAGLLPQVRDVRRAGSAALDLAWTAAGRLDAYYEHGLNAWDWAAGALACAEAGLAVEPLPAAEGLPAGLLVAAPELEPALRALLPGA